MKRADARHPPPSSCSGSTTVHEHAHVSARARRRFSGSRKATIPWGGLWVLLTLFPKRPPARPASRPSPQKRAIGTPARYASTILLVCQYTSAATGIVKRRNCQPPTESRATAQRDPRGPDRGRAGSWLRSESPPSRRRHPAHEARRRVRPARRRAGSYPPTGAWTAHPTGSCER